MISPETLRKAGQHLDRLHQKQFEAAHLTWLYLSHRHTQLLPEQSILSFPFLLSNTNLLILYLLGSIHYKLAKRNKNI